ncbi:MAG TPA: GatB/YqeY domain-containing protein [bacterium]|nr:GatB/YqeY domain-containing protein [bacterium]
MIANIRKDLFEAKKAHDLVKSNLLSTLLGEAMAVGKNAGNRETTPEEVMQIIRKFMKNIDETIAILSGEGKPVDKEKTEKAILEGYLPKQLTAEELAAAIDAIVATLPEKSPKAMGQVMAKLKELYVGRYDGKTANQLVKDKLAPVPPANPA